MHNPFEALQAELIEIKSAIKNIAVGPIPLPPEIIDTKELCIRLAVSEPTVISMRKRKLPYFRVGSSIRYDWQKVLAHLETSKKK